MSLTQNDDNDSFPYHQRCLNDNDDDYSLHDDDDDCHHDNDDDDQRVRQWSKRGSCGRGRTEGWSSATGGLGCLRSSSMST